ncbi:hypothetical protein Pmani_030226 [Petrolisthes manimaculis]|uniref:Uncharacterized protein n=1 Tax=Petrolisthes manimaculis TaxID=1843537 RepID=A0AAE1NXY0_9EUCA|nr:hypothetical protein Pmani_030226 [Petrolisthes manimaculis]
MKQGPNEPSRESMGLSCCLDPIANGDRRSCVDSRKVEGERVTVPDSHHLPCMLSSRRSFVWVDGCQHTFDNLKSSPVRALVLRAPDPQKQLSCM